ncbi:MAG: hypothetical protein NC320_01375 [Clostridium sp.]|nr:hypothetical protein [Clostridium sp.]MCM1547822.1 hypothetical protein [Ruminococcus sp.]
MGLFSHFKKNSSYFDKNIEPKCAYCEHGKPARSVGKILCQRCGLVDENYSCKKFTYSPFLRIPERDSGKSDTNKDITEPQETKTPEPPVSAALSAPSKSEQKPKKESQSDSKPISESAEKQPTSVSPAVKIADKEKIKKAQPLNDTHAVSNINNKPADNSENIAKLEAIEKASLSSIENHVPPKRINLPEINQSAIASIENKLQKRNSDEYLRTVAVKEVSGFKNKETVRHELPPDTKIVSVSDIK